MSHCLCCNSSLLQHVRHGSLYGYCPRCRQDMPATATPEAAIYMAERSASLVTAAAPQPVPFHPRATAA